MYICFILQYVVYQKKNNTVLEFEKQVPNLVTVQQQNSNKTNVLLSQGCQGPRKIIDVLGQIGKFCFHTMIYKNY